MFILEVSCTSGLPLDLGKARGLQNSVEHRSRKYAGVLPIPVQSQIVFSEVDFCVRVLCVCRQLFSGIATVFKFR